MDRRVVYSGAAALLLHASALTCRLREPPAGSGGPMVSAETNIDVLPLPPEPPELSEPLPPPPVDTALTNRSKPRKLVARAASVPSTSADDSKRGDDTEATPPTPSDTVMGLPDGEPDRPAKRLTLAQLGLGAGANSWAQPAPDAPARGPDDAAGLKQELMNADTRLGLGPGGAVAAEVRTVATDLAPLDSEVTLSIDLSSSGSVEEISIDEASSQMIEWQKVCRALRQRLKRPFAVRGPLRVRLKVTSESSTRSGKSHGQLSFDVSDIGSPTMQVVHVRVLAQLPL